MIEQPKQESSENNVKSITKTAKKGRSQEEKIGRLKYNQFLLKRVLAEIKEVRNMQRIILNGLKGARRNQES